METIPHGSVPDEECRICQIEGEYQGERPQHHAVQPAGQGNINATCVFKPLQTNPSIANGGSSPSVQTLSPRGITIGSPAIGVRRYGLTHRDKEFHQAPDPPLDHNKHISIRSEHIYSGSSSANTSTNTSLLIDGGKSINLGSNLDGLETYTPRRQVSGPVVNGGRGATHTASTCSVGYNNVFDSTQHVTCVPGMTTFTSHTASHHTHRLFGGPINTTHMDAYCVDNNFTPIVNIDSSSNMLLSPTSSEVGLLTMDSDSRTSSRTSTPTMVRTRPRVPTGLMRHKDILAVAAAAVNSGNLTPPMVIHPPGSEDIACDFTSLGRTDFVRKYSTKVRSNTDPIPSRSLRVESPGLGKMPASLPASTQNTLFVVPGDDMERDKNTRPHTLGGMTPTRTRSIKLKLERLHKARRSSDSQPEGLNLDPNMLAKLIRQGSRSPETNRKDSTSSCETDSKKSSQETTGPLDTYCTTGVNNYAPRGQLQKLHINHSHPPMGEERRYHTFPGRRSASPVTYSKHPSDPEVGNTVSKTVVADRRLCHQNAMDKVSVDAQDRPGQQSVESNINPITSSYSHHNHNTDSIRITIPETIESPLKLVRPTIVHWQLGRDSLDSDRSSPPEDNQKTEEIDTKKVSDIAEDEGVDVDSGGCDNVAAMPGVSRIGPWVNLTPDIQRRAVRLLHSTTNSGDKDNAHKSTARSDSAVSAPSKMPNGRFLTHPPTKERNYVVEGGSKDSNGFGALRDGKIVEETLELLSQEDSQLGSELSIDSQSCIDDQNYSTYHEVFQDVTADGTDIDNKLERKNSKSLKQKSKSDPCGEKEKESLRSPGSPLIIDELSNSAQVLSGSLTSSVIKKPTSVSDSSVEYAGRRDNEQRLLLGSSIEEEPIILPESPYMMKAHRSSSRKRNNRTSKEANKDTDLQGLHNKGVTTPNDAKNVKIVPITPIIVESDSEFRCSDAQSPDSTLVKGATLQELQPGSGLASLTLPFSKGKNTALTRSHSSASVFLSKAESYRNTTPSPGSHRQKDLVKRRPHFMDHLGPSAAGVDKSSHKRDTSWTPGYFPSLEPIYAQSSLSLFDGALEEKVSRLSLECIVNMHIIFWIY